MCSGFSCGNHLAVTGYRDLETQALTGNMKERKVLKVDGHSYCSPIVPTHFPVFRGLHASGEAVLDEHIGKACASPGFSFNGSVHTNFNSGAHLERISSTGRMA